jgi:glutamyl-tRNA reductase
MDVGPTISALKQQMNDIAGTEFERNRKRLGDLTPDQEQAIKSMMASLTNKLSHPLIVRLKQSAEAGIDDDLAKLYLNRHNHSQDDHETIREPIREAENDTKEN